MAFPNDPLDVRTEMYAAGTWEDITGDVYARAPIEIVRGKPPEASFVDPGKCSLVLNNRDGKYSPRNPRSPYYGVIGRNTPIRVSVPGPESYLVLDGSEDNVASSEASPGLGLSDAIDVRVEVSAAWAVLGVDRTLIGQYDGVSGDGWALRVTSDRRLSLFVPTTGGSGGMVADLPTTTGERVALRATFVADDGTGIAQNALYTAASLDGPWEQFGSFSQSSEGTMIDSTLPVELAPGYLNSSGEARIPIEGLVHRAQVRNAVDGAVVADPDFRGLLEGDTAFTDSAGLSWAIEGAAEVSDRAYRFNGEVSEWPQEWDLSGSDAWTAIQAAGVMRRLGQGDPTLHSTLRRRIPGGGEDGQVPLAYWPMEEGQYATQAFSPLDDVAPLRTSGLQWGSDDSLFGAESLPVLGQEASIWGDVTGAAPGGWHVDMAYFLDGLPGTDRELLRVNISGSKVQYARVSISTAGVRIGVYDEDDTLIQFGQFNDPDALADFVGVWNRISIYTSTDGSDTYVQAQWRDVVTGARWYVQTVYTGDPGAVSSVQADWSSDLQGMAIGHLGAWDVGGTGTASTTAAPGITYFDDADDGYEREPAYHRMARLSIEESVPIFLWSGEGGSARVGPQRVQALLDLLEEAAQADGGLLYEHRRTRGLAARFRTSLYQQPVALTLDYAADREVAPPLSPIDGDQGVANDVEVHRVGGSSGRAVLREGALSVQPPPDGIGRATKSLNLNLGSDSQTEPMAHWHLHLGTWDESRYPEVKVRLHAAPHLIDQVLAVDVLDRMQILNPPPWIPPGTIDLLAEGYTERLGVFEWEVDFNCSPAGPWNVGRLVGEQQFFEGFEDDTLALTFTDEGDVPWGRDSAQSHTGGWSLRSGEITHDQTSRVILHLPTGSTELSFWYRVDSEATFDFLRVFAGGATVVEASGLVDWTRVVLDVTGLTEVTFEYTKDSSTSVAGDAGWIDDLTLMAAEDPGTDQPNRADTAGARLSAPAGESDTELTVYTDQGPLWTEDPAEFPFDVNVGGEVVRVSSIEEGLSDTFERTVADGWGVADTGQPWSTEGGAASDYAVDGDGVVSVGETNSSRYCITPAPSSDVDISATIATDVLAAGGPHYPSLVARRGGFDDLYLARIEFETDQDVVLGIRKRVGGNENALAQVVMPFEHAPGTRYAGRFQIVGSTLRAKAWLASEEEPRWWHLEAEDSELVGPGTVGVRSILSSLNTNTLPVEFRWDDFLVRNPQRFTVTRSINGVTKAHASETDVRLAKPMIIAL